jgi:hypothetical protein
LKHTVSGEQQKLKEESKSRGAEAGSIVKILVGRIFPEVVLEFLGFVTANFGMGLKK